MLDHTGLYARLTVRENLRYFSELQRIAETDLSARINEVLAQLNLLEIADQRAGALSLGQSTKVALGRVLIHSPKNLLLDEARALCDSLVIVARGPSLRRVRPLNSAVCPELNLWKTRSSLSPQPRRPPVLTFMPSRFEFLIY